MSHEPLPKHSVSVAAAVIDEEGRALAVQRRDNGKWEPPGGVLELGETISEGLAREVYEETGLTIAPESVSGVYKNMKHGIVAIVFRCHATGGELRESDETKGFAWLTPDEIQDRMTEVFAVRILDAYEPDGPKVRSHDGVNLL